MNLTRKFVLEITIILKLLSLSLCYPDNNNQVRPGPMLGINDDIKHVSAPKPGWIDPFDMLGETRSRDALFVQSEVEIHVLQKRCNSYEVYLRRFVNMFLNAVELRDGQMLDGTMNLVKLEFWINGKDINTLKEFGQGDNDAKIEFVSDVFTKIFSQKTSQNRNIFILNDVLTWFKEKILLILSSPEWTVFSSVSAMLIMTLWFVFRTQSYRLALFTLFLTIFLGGFGFTWIRMYEEKEIERYVNIIRHGEIPRHCSSQSQMMAWYEHMYYRMFGVDCQQFFQSRDIRPIVKVSPIDVLAETVSSLIVKPASSIGKAYGNFASGLLEGVPWWLKPIAVPIGLCLPLLFVIVLFVFLFNYRLSLSITGFHLLPTWAQTSNNVLGNNHQYVEDCPRKETQGPQPNTHIPFLDSETPLFVMNWKGLKKLSSSSLSNENNEKVVKEEAKELEGRNENGQSSLEDDCDKMMENLTEFEKFVESVEAQKAVEERKKRNIHTLTDGESSLTNRRSGVLLPLVEDKDLPPSEGNGSPTIATKEKDLKASMSMDSPVKN